MKLNDRNLSKLETQVGEEPIRQYQEFDDNLRRLTKDMAEETLNWKQRFDMKHKPIYAQEHIAMTNPYRNAWLTLNNLKPTN